MNNQKVKRGDLTTISDLLAHECDHAYTVASLLELLAEADLQLLDFADPNKYTVPPEAQEALAPLTSKMEGRFQLAHFAELLRGDIYIHSFWAASTGMSLQGAVAVELDSVLCPYWRFVGYRLVLPEDDSATCIRAGSPIGDGRGRVPTSC